MGARPDGRAHRRARARAARRVTSTPLPVAGQPVGGGAPQHAGELAADGRGRSCSPIPSSPTATRSCSSARPARISPPPRGPTRSCKAGERLVANATRPDARALLAVIGGADAEAATLVAPPAPTGRPRQCCVWTRRAGTARRSRPGARCGPSRWRPQAKRAWLLGTAGDGVVLLHREPTAGGEPRWCRRRSPDALLAGAALPAAIATVAVDAPAGGSAHGHHGQRVAGPARDAGRRRRRAST